jgi:flagellin-like hook-associated protein FlgL
MSLSVVSNVAALYAQNDLNRNSTERLAFGSKINSGSDGPAALVISEQNQAQIAGLSNALDNTNKAVSKAQTGEGALNQINSQLARMRGLALSSANAGENDANTLAANQSEIGNALSTINAIVNTTESGGSKLFANDSASPLSGLPIAPSSPADYAKAVAAYTKEPGLDLSALSFVNVTASGGADKALDAIDKAISDVSTLRGQLGAYQANALETNANNLRATLENTSAYESTIRDTDFSAEVANFTKQQVLMQAGQTVSSNASQTSQLVARLLSG